MPSFRFSHPIEVRYADLDPQRHVNNAAVFTYLEQARAKYLEHLGLWGGGDFDDLGIIVAEASATYKAPISYSDQVVVDTGEALGFDAVWTSETQHDPFLSLALVAEHASRLRFGTAVAIGFARSPTVLAPTAWGLAAASRGRFMLGLG